jgi:hypothetical protein
VATATGVRITLKFNFPQQIRFCGWSENIDTTYADLPTAIAALSAINAFIADRLQCLGVGPILVEAVLTGYVQPLTPGARPVRRSTISLVIPPPPPPGNAYNKNFNGSTPATADYGPTVYYIALQTNPSTNPVYHRNYWMAGLPDVADITDSPTIVDPATQVAVTKWLGDLNNTNASLGGKNNVAIRSIDRSGANPVKPCTAWIPGLLEYTVPLHGFVVGQPIVAEGMTCVKPGFAPRGRYLVGTVVDANTITLAGGTTPSTPINTGGFRPAIYTFNNVTVATPQGFTKRNKGRPFGLSLGRRRAPVTKRA